MKVDLVYLHEPSIQKIKSLVKWMLSIFYMFLRSQLLKRSHIIVLLSHKRTANSNLDTI